MGLVRRYRLPMRLTKGDPLLNHRRIGNLEHFSNRMEEPIISPDGKFVWTGSDWTLLDENNEIVEKNSNIEQENNLVYNRENERSYPPRYYHQIEWPQIFIGFLLLLVVFTLFPELVSGCEPDNCNQKNYVTWFTVIFMSGTFGIFLIILGLIGKKVAENPVQAILYELQFSRPSLDKIGEKIGVNPTLLRHILNDLKEKGLIIEVYEGNQSYFELK